MLYKAMVRPVIEYGIPAWSPFYWKDIDEIESVQRRATKLVPGFGELSYEDRLRKLDLPCLRYRRLRGDMIYIYKYLIDGMAANRSLFHRAVDSSTRGHPFKLLKPRCNKNVRQGFFTQRNIDFWNSLPAHVVNAPSLNGFKSNFDRVLKCSKIYFDYKADISLRN